MNKIKSILWLMVAAIAGGLAMVSCSSSNNDPITPVIPPRDNTPVDYTVMFYSAGGENLDAETENDLYRAAKALQVNDTQVRFIVQYKYSTQEGINKQYTGGAEPSGYAGGLYRFELLPSQINKNDVLDYFSDNLLYGDQQAKSQIYRSDSISSFINYCMRVAPARNYILLFSDHGGGYTVWGDYPKTRSIVTDNFHEGNPGISICDIRDGIAKSNLKHVKMVNFDACLMNSIEVISELTEVTDYVLASSFLTSGCDYTDFINYLRGAGDNAFEQQMSGYLNNAIQVYSQKTEDKNAQYLPASDPKKKRCNWVLTNTAVFRAEVLPALKAFTTKLINEDASNFGATGLQDAANNCYHPDASGSFYDIGQYITLLAKANNNLTAEAAAVKAAIEKAQVCHYYTTSVLGDLSALDYQKLSCSVNLGAQKSNNPIVVCLRGGTPDDQGKILYYGSDGNCYDFDTNTDTWDPAIAYFANYAWDNTYRTTAFDKATGWSKWLEKNTAFPTGNPPFVCK